MGMFTDILRDSTRDFYERMDNIRRMHSDDKELCHRLMDNLMCEKLRDLGFDEGVEIFEKTGKWYA